MGNIFDRCKKKPSEKAVAEENFGQVSDLYTACRNGDVDTAKKILVDTNSSGLNNLEPNGSTALHAASYYGHADIVHLLLQEPDIIVQQQNRFGLTAYEEAANVEIRQIFDRNDGKRFWENAKDSP